MARRTRAPKLETRTARLKLPIAKKPLWVKVGHGLSLGYRGNQSVGTWSVRVADGKGSHWVEALGAADDYADADGHNAFDYWQAQDRARAIGATPRARDDEDPGKLVTVEGAVAAYERELEGRGGDLANIQRIRKHLPPTLAGKTVALLVARDFKTWRAAMDKAGLAPASINRTNAALRAALNLAAKRDERIANRRAWETGLANLEDATESRNVILDDGCVRAIVAASYTVSEEFGLLVELAAVTGARLSQLARLEAQDVQNDRAPRLLIPGSRKGRRRRAAERRPVPIPAELAQRLLAGGKDRPATAPLLTKPAGAPWRQSDHTRLFARAVNRVAEQAREARRLDRAAAVELCGYAPAEVTIYALRHSSIVRQLIANVPLRIVAVNHDTSAAMIERTYSRHISDHSDVLSRCALIDLSAPHSDNVVALTR